MDARIIPSGGAAAFLDGVIYSFHMPLFFFISGLFLSQALARGWHCLLREKARTLLYAYVVWSVVYSAMKAAAGPVVNHPQAVGNIAWRLAFEPVLHFWFLYVLLIFFLLSPLVVRLPSVATLMLLAAAPCLAISLDYPQFMCVGQLLDKAIFFYLPYFLFRHTRLRSGEVKEEWGSGPIRIGLGSISLSALVCLIAVLPGWVLLLSRVPLAVIGILAVIAIAYGMRGSRCGSWLAFVGNLSLEIYILHTMFASGLRVMLLHHKISSPAVHISLGCVVGLAAPIVVSVIARHYGITWLFVLPRKRRTQPVGPALLAVP